MVTAVLVATVLFHQLDMEDQKVQTCNLYQTDPNLPHKFNNPECFHGYGLKVSNPLYRTSNQTYGSKKPTIHEMPTQFNAMSSHFSEAMLRGGMYRDHGFNTGIEKEKVSTASQNKRLRLHHLHHHGNQSNHEISK
ncbi:UPF0691 protein C9orf116 homolog [Nematolebias whitei]|uniref:UPF0691 protein C9orf116 homolog n=1 Tax=Nematolebias whitei TaxID=451745 RepID=UPI001896DF67|nr:UPF0691 protein C9orf116 homolog [Nematolebias whitei]